MKYAVAVLLGLVAVNAAAEVIPEMTEAEMTEAIRKGFMMDKDFDMELNIYEYFKAW